jgi:hypothetical protein
MNGKGRLFSILPQKTPFFKFLAAGETIQKFSTANPVFLPQKKKVRFWKEVFCPWDGVRG